MANLFKLFLLLEANRLETRSEGIIDAGRKRRDLLLQGLKIVPLRILFVHKPFSLGDFDINSPFIQEKAESSRFVAMAPVRSLIRMHAHAELVFLIYPDEKEQIEISHDGDGQKAHLHLLGIV